MYFSQTCSIYYAGSLIVSEIITIAKHYLPHTITTDKSCHLRMKPFSQSFLSRYNLCFGALLISAHFGRCASIDCGQKKQMVCVSEAGVQSESGWMLQAVGSQYFSVSLDLT